MVNADARGYEEASALVRRADEAGLDLVGVPDHLYSRGLLDTLSSCSIPCPLSRRSCPGRAMVVKGVDRQASGRRRKQRDPSFFLVSATWDGQRWVLPFPPSELLGHMWQRREVEGVPRECKSGFGPARSNAGAGRLPFGCPMAAWAYGVLVPAGYRARGMNEAPIRPPGRWWKSPASK